jgi:hypothetical protein
MRSPARPRCSTRKTTTISPSSEATIALPRAARSVKRVTVVVAGVVAGVVAAIARRPVPRPALRVLPARRRRRGRGDRPETGAEAGAPRAAGSGGGGGGGGGGLPSYTASPAFETGGGRGEGRREENRRENGHGRNDGQMARAREDGEPVYRGPQVIDLAADTGHALDDLAGKDLADAVLVILSTFDRNAGAVSLRQIAETAQRRGRLAGDAQLVQSQIAAAVRADNHRRVNAGQRPRFRFAGGRVALTDWLLGGDLGRLEQEALAAVERYRDAARRAFARKLGELPGHAFVEVCVLALERIGLGQLRAIRRPGAPGGESHFSAVLKAAGDEVKTAIVIRRDGRPRGRSRARDRAPRLAAPLRSRHPRLDPHRRADALRRPRGGGDPGHAPDHPPRRALGGTPLRGQ